jgi:hypothetical protein
MLQVEVDAAGEDSPEDDLRRPATSPMNNPGSDNATAASAPA